MAYPIDMLEIDARRKPTANRGFQRMFQPGRMTLGLFFPIEAFCGDRPGMRGQVALAQRAEQGGFSALWFRDVPLRDPTFGDVGQVFDPWVYLGYITAQTREIALATGAVVLPLRHPIHTAKAAASIDQLSEGRLVLGVASGDRPVEFPAFGRDFEARGADFRDHLAVFRQLLGESYPEVSSPWGEVHGVDLVPKAWADGIPVLVTGNSQQSLDWIAAHGEGWVTYPRALPAQIAIVQSWRAAVARVRREDEFLPFAQSLYIDLDADPDCPVRPIHLGVSAGRHRLVETLARLHMAGVNHVALNLKYGRRPAGEVLDELIEHVLPEFPTPHPGHPVA